MTAPQSGSGPKAESAPAILPPRQSALERLQQIKDARTTLLGEIRKNWAGWLFSAFLHVTVLGLLIVLVVSTVEPPRVFSLKTYEENIEELSEQPLEDLYQKSPVEEEIEELSVDPEEQSEFKELDPGAPDYLTTGGQLTGLGQGGGGDGLTGRGFGRHLHKLKETGLDIVFVFDSTGSMGGILLETKMRIRQLMKVVNYLVPGARLGLVTYRDKKDYDLDDYEYTTKYLSLTQDVKALEKFLRETNAFGGGDIPEAIYEGLDVAINRTGWDRGSTKVIVLFGDAPPRSEDEGLSKLYAMVGKWHKSSGGVISCIDTAGGSRLMEEFKEIATSAGGDATFLNNERDIIKQLVIYVFGKEWQKEIDKVYNAVLKDRDEGNVIGGGMTTE